MRPSFSADLSRFIFFSFSFFLGASLGTAAASAPPSVNAAVLSGSSSFHPANTIEEACHLMVDDDKGYEAVLTWYPYCVVILQSNPESRNATIHKLAVLALEIAQQDALVELKRMQVLKSKGVGGDPQEMGKCLSGFGSFIPVLQSGINDLQKDGRADFRSFFVDVQRFVDCRWMFRNPVKKQLEILALLNAVNGICNKYCRYPAPKPCRFA